VSGSARRLAEDELRHLRQFGWHDYVGRDQAIWVVTARQRLLLVAGDRVERSYPCSTAQSGVGSRKGSLCTPQGWHEIREKTGGGLPEAAVLKAGKWTGNVWVPGEARDEDLVLSRILRLSGLQEGRNRGGEVDTWDRRIYIHGTNSEHLLGQAVSHGCVRLANSDVIELFDLVRVGCKVLITPS